VCRELKKRLKITALNKQKQKNKLTNFKLTKISVSGPREKTMTFTPRGFKMFGKYSPRVDFTNILLAAFTHADPKSAKKSDSLIVSCAFGSAWVKALRKTFGKYSPRRISLM